MNHNKNRFPANDDYVNATMPIFHLLVPTVISIHFSQLLTEGLPSNERMCKWSFLLKGHIRIANPRIVLTYKNLARMTSNSLVIDSQIYCPKTRSVFMISYNNKPSLLCHFTTRGRRRFVNFVKSLLEEVGSTSISWSSLETSLPCKLKASLNNHPSTFLEFCQFFVNTQHTNTMCRETVNAALTQSFCLGTFGRFRSNELWKTVKLGRDKCRWNIPNHFVTSLVIAWKNPILN